MALNRIGQSTIVLPSRPKLVSSAAIAGKKEGEGPLRSEFDEIIEDDLFGEETWEKAESRFQYTAADLAIKKAGLTHAQIDAALGGDLLNQIMAASLAVRELHTPFIGVYGACSTMAESLCMASMLVDGGYLQSAVCTASSHFCTAERQYRFPLEYGCQRPPTAQWTVTGAGSVVVSSEEKLPAICCSTHLTLGRIVDMAIKDANNMGAAMAPAAADTLCRHLSDMNRTAADYDLIITGDLGQVGHDLLLTLMQERGQPLDPARYMDCGLEVFSPDQDTHAGGSGCGCSAVTLCGYILHRFARGELHRVLFMATGALLSPTSTQQGDTIPGIAHAIVLEAES
ncbi:MAG: stage V sporulation protein AD [Clostridiales bacterium]|nr:stage V sporulation protein AD [Clostridiales bacterium]